MELNINCPTAYYTGIFGKSHDADYCMRDFYNFETNSYEYLILRFYLNISIFPVQKCPVIKMIK
jgi:hypothetical protein